MKNLLSNNHQCNLNDIEKLAETCNELCVAVESYKISKGSNIDKCAWEHLIQRKMEVWDLLKKFGY